MDGICVVVEETQWVYIHLMTKITPMHYSFRIQLQDIVRRSSMPGEQEVIDKKRAALVAMFAQLKDLQMVAGVMENSLKEKLILDNETEFDEYDEYTNHTHAYRTQSDSLPLNGNLETDVSDLKIKFWICQANSKLNQLRDLIADISFQFSHVIRGQIHKNI